MACSKRLSISQKKLKNPLKALLLFSGYNLLFGAIIPWIDNAGHVGGLISGLLIGFLLAFYRKPVAVNMDAALAPPDAAQGSAQDTPAR